MKKTEILYKANGSLARLTKVRCSLDISQIDKANYKPCNLISWPFYFEKDKKLLSCLQKYKIYPDNQYKTSGYEILYDEYKRLNCTDTIDILELRYLRSCIVVFNLINSPKKLIDVGLVWDKKENKYPFIPKSTDDSSFINELSDKRDVQYTFTDHSGNWLFKAPAFLGPIIFNDLSLFSSQPIRNSDLRNFRGGKTDSDGRSKRIIIDHSQRAYLDRIINITKSNILAILPNDSWNEKVKKSVFRYYDTND